MNSGIQCQGKTETENTTKLLRKVQTCAIFGYRQKVVILGG